MSKRKPAHFPPLYKVADVHALQALAKGDANPSQQARALKWIIENAALTYDVNWFSTAEGGEWDSSFSNGRAFVGKQIVKLLNMTVEMKEELSKHE